MKWFILFLMLASRVFAAEEVILHGDIILAEDNIGEAFKIRKPQWAIDFEKEASRYHYEKEQPSLSRLRGTKGGNCVAFAKLGTSYAMKAGYNCKLIVIACKQSAHMFLYATGGGEHWLVSNQLCCQVDSVNMAIVKMHCLGQTIRSQHEVTTDNPDSIPTDSYDLINDRSPNGARINFSPDGRDYNIDP